MPLAWPCKAPVRLKRMAAGTLNQHWPGGHAGGHVRGTHARGKRAERAIGAGVGIRANDAVACGHKAFFRAAARARCPFPHIVEIQDIVFVRKHAALPGLLAALMSLLGTKWSITRLIFVLSNTASKPRLFKFVDGHGAGDIVAQHHIQLCLDELARYNGISPACAARIFCVIVIPIVLLLPPVLCFWDGCFRQIKTVRSAGAIRDC